MDHTKTLRVKYIDLAKALGMLTIVWAHIMLTGVTFEAAYAFHIPLFFFLSGITFKRHKYTTWGSFLKSRFLSLMLPYAIFSVATWLLWIAYNLILQNPVDNFFYPLLQTVLAQGSDGFLEHNPPLWFVPCLMIVEILYFFISKTKNWLNVTICVLCAIIGYLMLNVALPFDFTLLPWSIESALSALIFYAAGNLITTRFGIMWVPNIAQKKRLLTVGVILILTVLLFFVAPLNGHISLGSNSLGHSVLLFYLLAFCGTFSTLLFAALLEDVSLPGLKLITRFLCWVGRNSFYFMALHMPIKSFIGIIVAKLFGVSTSTVYTHYGFSAIVFVLCMIATSVAVLILSLIMNLIRKRPRKSAVT